MPDQSSSASTTDELRRLLQETEQALGNTAEDAGEKFDALRDRLRHALEGGRTSLKHLRDETVKRAQQADQMVRENPYYAIGIAAGVGALIGVLVSRSCQQSR